MRFRRLSLGLMLAVALAALSIGLSACGSGTHATARKATVIGAAGLAIHHHEKKVGQKKAATGGGYRVGEFCSLNNEAAYRKAGLVCAKEKNSYRLQKR